MNDTKGDGPINPIKPQRPKAITPTSGTRQLSRPPANPVSRAPPPARKSNSVSPPRRDSDSEGAGAQEFSRRMLDSEPPSEGMHSEGVDIDVDAEFANAGARTTESNFPSVVVEFGDPESTIPEPAFEIVHEVTVSELPESPVMVEKPVPEPEPPVLPEANLEKSSSLIRRFTKALLRVHPAMKENKLEFTKEGIFLESERIGDVEQTRFGTETRVWMHKIGFTMDSLPTSALFGLFNISGSFFSDSLRQASYVSIYAKGKEDKVEIKLCFHKKETPASFLSFPLNSSMIIV